jgi:hypothetical protein
VIRIFVETPFVLQLALRQEHGAVCTKLLTLADTGEIELVVPLLALVEPLGTLRVRASKNIERNNGWRAEARELARTNEPHYRRAAQALQDAGLFTAQMHDEERRNLNEVIARLWKSARVALPGATTFQTAFELEAKGQSGRGQTGLDALAIATILEDARSAPPDVKMGFFALDRRAVNALIREDLSAANVKFFLETESLTGWLKSEHVDVLDAADAPATAPPSGASSLPVDDDGIISNDGSE